ncbi:MAG: helix-turn-helix domain-containing protein [Acidimicrobiales bacterium]
MGAPQREGAVSDLQQQARALGDPTRHEIFRYLADADDPVDVAELTAHLGLNHNAIRQHLGKLVDAGLVVESTRAPSGRGRPRLEYRIDPRADERWTASGPYERLAVLLTEVVRSGEAPIEVGRRAGRRLRTVAVDGQGPVDVLADQMARQGFEPVLRPRGDVVDVVLQACPFASAVLADAATICDLHLGLATGIAEAVGGVEVEELVAKDPRRAHCRLRCRSVAAVP